MAETRRRRNRDREKLRERRSPIAPWLLVVGLLVGGAAGYYLYDLGPVPMGLSDLIAKGREVVDRTWPSSPAPDRAPEGWEAYYRRAPEAGSPTDSRPAAAIEVHFWLCHVAAQRTCVVDGDTIRYRGQKIRIADIDTPEIFSPKCASEEALGQRAKHRLLELLNAGPIAFVRVGDRDKDRFGRLLRVIMRDGRSLGDILVAEGLARRWDGARHPWC